MTEIEYRVRQIQDATTALRQVITDEVKKKGVIKIPTDIEEISPCVSVATNQFALIESLNLDNKGEVILLLEDNESIMLSSCTTDEVVNLIEAIETINFYAEFDEE